MSVDTLAQEILVALKAGKIGDKAQLHSAKQRLTRKHGLTAVPRDSELIESLGESGDEFVTLLRKKPMRSASGVAVIAIMTSPASCPHGKCIYCPGGPEVDAPQSYTGFEPSTMRAKRLDYDPYKIIRTRMAGLEANGHSVDKLDVVLQGGTFPARDDIYQDWVICALYTGANHGPSEAPEPFEAIATWSNLTEAERRARILAAQIENESAKCRVIGLTIETKPDWCLEPHVSRMLLYGCTRVEIGIQTMKEEILTLTHRGHGVKEIYDSMRIAKDAGLKICVHMMPGLPGNTPESDVEEFRDLFVDEGLRPDMLKIYPTLVVEEGETTLKRWFKEGKFKPYDTETAMVVVGKAKDFIPEYCRIQRIDRDIPTTHVIGGVMNSNLRQLAQKWREERGLPPCKCIRCRESIRQGLAVDSDDLVLDTQYYNSSGGIEAFIQLIEPDTRAIAGFLRIRKTSPKSWQEELAPGSAIIRELKVYGTAIAIGEESSAGALQHRGLGAKLLAEAHRIAFEEWKLREVYVISGVGVKAYYRRHRYTSAGPYLVLGVES